MARFMTIAMPFEFPVMPADLGMHISTVQTAAPAAMAVMIEFPMMPAATAMLIITLHLVVSSGCVNVYNNCDVD